MMTNPDGTEAPFYNRHRDFKQVYCGMKDGIKLSIWFDGFAYTPLIERLNDNGVPIKGKLLRDNVRLVKAIKQAEKWLQENL